MVYNPHLIGMFVPYPDFHIVSYHMSKFNSYTFCFSRQSVDMKPSPGIDCCLGRFTVGKNIILSGRRQKFILSIR